MKPARDLWLGIKEGIAAVSFVIFAILAFAVTIVAIIHWGAWIERHEATAAWVQAAGIFWTLVAAILIPLQQTRSENKRRADERTRRSRSFAFLFAGYMYPFASDVSVLYRDLTQERDRRAPPPRTPGDWHRWFDGARLKLPASFEGLMPLTFDMDETWVEPIRDVTATSASYNLYLDSFREFDTEIELDAWHTMIERIIENLSLVCGALDDMNKLYSNKSIGELLPEGPWARS